MKYLRLFDTHADYQDFTETQEFILPNVSRCRASNDVHYNPIPETRLIVTYSIVDDGGTMPALNLAKGGKINKSMIPPKIFFLLFIFKNLELI